MTSFAERGQADGAAAPGVASRSLATGAIAGSARRPGAKLTLTIRWCQALRWAQADALIRLRPRRCERSQRMQACRALTEVWRRPLRTRDREVEVAVIRNAGLAVVHDVARQVLQ